MKKSKKNSSTDSKKYVFVEAPGRDFTAIKLTKGKYKNVILKYGKVAFAKNENKDGTLPMKFDYDLLQIPKNLKDLKKDLEKISGDVIPTMMTEMNISTLKLADGSAVEVKPVYSASIPIAKKEEAFNWLRDNDLGDLIKNEVTVSFGRNEDNKALQYANLAQGQGYQPIQKLKVEPMTLKALVRERVESGKDMPSDLFNVFAGNRTKLTRKQ